MSAFGPGVTCKPTLVRYDKTYLSDFTRWTTNGTGDTTITAEDTTVGSFFQTTVTNTDDQAGHIYLGDGPITFVAGTRFKFVALVRWDGTTAGVAVGFSDGFATPDTGVLGADGAVASSDSILVHKLTASAFFRGGITNAGAQTVSGATTTAATHNIWYRVTCAGEAQTNGIHARFYASDLSGAVAGDINYYTIGYDSGVSPVAASGVDNLRFGCCFQTGTTTQIIGGFKPLLLEYSTIAS